jgi:endonuclease/exonuclease/phosphatase family metal-dependent hydrolase
MLFILFLVICFLVLLSIITKLWIKITGLTDSILQKYKLNDIVEKQKRDNKKIKFMSFNFYLQSFITCDDYKNGDCKYERFNHFIDNYLNEYDIICFQEVYGTLSLFCNKLITKAKHKGFHWYVVPKSLKLNSFKFMDSGLLTISKYPILYTETVQFKNGLYKDKLAEKSFQYCIIDTLNKNTNKKYLHIINTHLQSEYKIRDENAMNIKFKQLKQIKDFIDFYNLRKEAVLFCGDFNINCFYLNGSYKNEQKMYSKDYYKLLSMLNLSINNDCFHNTNYTRKTTLYCTYDKKTGKEIDTRHRPEYYYEHNKNYINIPRCVDYIFFTFHLQNWLNISNSKVEKMYCVTSDKNLQQCSDHYALTVELILN